MPKYKKNPGFVQTFFVVVLILMPVFWLFWLLGERNDPFLFLLISAGAAIGSGIALGLMNVLLNLGSSQNREG
jgi:hypothetical protein